MAAQHIHLICLCLMFICYDFIFYNRHCVVYCSSYNAFRFHNPYTHDIVVVGGLIKSVKKRSVAECANLCIGEKTCSSFNFGKKDTTCELNYLRIGDVEVVTTRQGYRYFEIQRDGE